MEAVAERAPNQTPPEATRQPTQAADEAISDEPQGGLRLNRFSLFTTRPRTFIFPSVPKSDPASTKPGIPLKSWSRINRLARSRRAAKAAIEEPPGDGRRSQALVEDLAPSTTAQHSTNSKKGQRLINSSIKSVVRHESAHQLTLQQPNEFKQLEKEFFVASSMDVPEELHQRWEKDVLPQLIRDIGEFGTSLRLKTHEINGHEELKMAGSEAIRTAMKPTVIITCRNEGFKRKLEKEINGWGYMKKLDVPIRTIVESKEAALPGWAASLAMASEGATHTDPGPATRLISCQIERVVGHRSACGLWLKFVVDFGGSQSTRFSRLGGLILVGDKIYGLTTGHSIVAWLAQPGAASVHDSNSDNLASQDFVRLSKDNEFLFRNPLASQDSDLRSDSGAQNWRAISWHEPFVFAGQCFVEGEVQSPVWNVKHLNSDWALVAVDDCDFAENSYQEPNGSQVTISEIVPLDQLKSGPVLVLSGLDRAQAGFLSQNSSVLHMGDSAFRVKQIVMQRSIGSGGSGSWVVRDGKLCGYIVAIQDDSLVYMLPIDGVFKDIASATGSEPVRLVSENDIKTVKPRDKPNRASLFTSLATPRASSNDIMTSSIQPMQEEGGLPEEPHPPMLPESAVPEPRHKWTHMLQIPKPFRSGQRRRIRRSITSTVSVWSQAAHIYGTARLWSALKKLFRALQKAIFTERSSHKLLRIAYRSAWGLCFFHVVEIVMIMLVLLGPTVSNDIYLVSFSYHASQPTNSSSQLNPTFLIEFANSTRNANVEVRVSHFSVCVSTPISPWHCSRNTASYRYDSLNLMWTGGEFNREARIWPLIFAGVLLSIFATSLLFYQFIIPVRQEFRHKLLSSWIVEHLSERNLSERKPPLPWSVFRKPAGIRVDWRSRFVSIMVIYAMVICQLVAFVFLLVGATWQQFTAIGASVTIRAFGNGAVTAHVGTTAMLLSWFALALAFSTLFGLKSVVRLARAYLRSLMGLDDSLVHRHNTREIELEPYSLTVQRSRGVDYY